MSIFCSGQGKHHCHIILNTHAFFVSCVVLLLLLSPSSSFCLLPSIRTASQNQRRQPSRSQCCAASRCRPVVRARWSGQRGRECTTPAASSHRLPLCHGPRSRPPSSAAVDFHSRRRRKRRGAAPISTMTGADSATTHSHANDTHRGRHSTVHIDRPSRGTVVPLCSGRRAVGLAVK
jgi:hypothetical protein